MLLCLWLILEDYNVVLDDIIDDVIEVYFDVVVLINVVDFDQCCLAKMLYDLKKGLCDSSRGCAIAEQVLNTCSKHMD